MKRRDFLRGAVVGSGAMLLDRAAGRFAAASLSSIQHVVVVTMENRSFDHFLGWLGAAADGLQAGLSYLDSSNNVVPTYPLAPDYKGCGHPDPDHSYTGGHTQWDNGNMDKFLQTGSDRFAVGYYVDTDMPFLAALARNYTVCSRFFSSILAETYPNRLFMHSATTDRLTNTLNTTNLPTIWDRLAAKGISRRYYYSNYSFLSLWGLFKYWGISRSYSQFLNDCAAGSLPAVCYVEPRFEPSNDDGSGTDDHPHADIRRGDAWLSQTFYAVASRPALWASTVFIVVFDEWGGFFDHVAPPWVTPPKTSGYVDTFINGSGQVLAGFRVPCIVASPWSRNLSSTPRVVSTVFDHTSILKLIESRWSLTPLTLRDASSDIGNLASALDFSTTNSAVPNLPKPPMPAAVGC